MISYIKKRRTLLFAILSMSLPAIIEMALNTLLGLADTIMIGRFIGSDALSGVGFANQIVFTLIFVFSSFNTGGVAMVSRALGEKNYDKLKRIAEQCVNLNLVISLVVALPAFIFRESLLSIFDMTPEVMNSSVLYFSILIISFIPMFLSFSFAAVLRGSGNTMTPMVFTGIANIINIIGNYVLILGIGPFPEMGIAGAAVATTGSRFLALFLYSWYLYIRRSPIRLKIKFFFDKHIVRSLWKISLPGAVEQALMQLSFVMLGVIISSLDTTAEAAFRILVQVESVSFMPAVGMSIAAATLVGKSLGEKNIEKGLDVGYLSSIMAILWGIFVGALFLLFPESILKLFIKETAVIAVGITAIPLMAINQMALNFTIVMSGALRGAGDTRNIMIITVARLWLVFVPFSWFFIMDWNKPGEDAWYTEILSFIGGKGVAGVWYAEMLSFLIFSLVVFFRFRGKKWAGIKI